MPDFEGVLARAEARGGGIPASVVPAIEAKSSADLFDLRALARRAEAARRLPVVRRTSSLAA